MDHADRAILPSVGHGFERPRVVHVTTVHSRRDNRIFKRECQALREAGLDVHLVVADGRSDAVDEGIPVHDVGRPLGRAQRMTRLSLQAMRRARALRPKIIHFHDPELLPIAAWMAMKGVKIIYDAHEDLPRSIMSKEWISRPVRRGVSIAAESIEEACASRLSAIVAATPVIAQRFAGGKPVVETVCNYPDLSAAPKPSAELREASTFIYIGALSEHRGIREMLEAVVLADARLILAGPFGSSDQLASISAMAGWSRVEYLGVVDHKDIWSLLQRAQAGLLFLHPVQNYIQSLPTKMYEYMAMALPILSSNYQGWPDVITRGGLGLTCDPKCPTAIAALMRQIIENPEEARAMGDRGRATVMAQFRWENEAAKLVALYERLLGGRPKS